MNLEDVKLWRTEGGALACSPDHTGELGDASPRTPYGPARGHPDNDTAIYLVGFSTEAEAEAYVLGVDHANGEADLCQVERVAPDLVVAIVEWDDEAGEPGVHYYDERRR